MSSKSVSLPPLLTTCFIAKRVVGRRLSADRSKAAISPKNVTFGLFVRASLIVAYLKQKSRRELSYTASRILLNDHPLQDTLTLGESNIIPGSCLRVAKGKEKIKMCRKYKRPGSKQRRIMEPAEAHKQVTKLLGSMKSKDEKAVQKLLTDEGKMLLTVGNKISIDEYREVGEPVDDDEEEEVEC